MAVNREVSARYSFSHDISLAPFQSEQCELDTGIDFEFGISGGVFDQESSSADELFAQGILLPREIREKGVSKSEQPITEVSTLLESEQKARSKTSFWSLKRSTSLNLNLHAECNKKGFLCSLQEGLSRSNSTGSVPNPKKSTQNKEKAAVPNSSKHPPLPKSSSTSSSSSSSASSSYNQYHHKPQHPKSYYGGTPYSPRGGGGSRTNSILNVPPPYISNTNLFGLGSLFRNGKEKKPRNDNNKDF